MKVLTGVACIAFGIWLMQNHPDFAVTFLNYVMNLANQAVSYVTLTLAQS
jgi:hypothetical protein